MTVFTIDDSESDEISGIESDQAASRDEETTRNHSAVIIERVVSVVEDIKQERPTKKRVRFLTENSGDDDSDRATFALLAVKEEAQAETAVERRQFDQGDELPAPSALMNVKQEQLLAADIEEELYSYADNEDSAGEYDYDEDDEEHNTGRIMNGRSNDEAKQSAAARRKRRGSFRTSDLFAARTKRSTTIRSRSKAVQQPLQAAAGTTSQDVEVSSSVLSRSQPDTETKSE